MNYEQSVSADFEDYIIWTVYLSIIYLRSYIYYYGSLLQLNIFREYKITYALTQMLIMDNGQEYNIFILSSKLGQNGI